MFIVKETGQVIEKRGKTFRTKIDYDLFPERKCSYCSKNILDEKTASIIEKDFVITVRCKLDYKEYLSVVCWECRPPHSMNPNSIKYNMIKFGLNENEAISLIHSRNKSPFYASNHDSFEEYRKFQSHDNFSEERKQEIQIKQNIGREKWANKLGKENVKKIKDSSSLEFHIKKYGRELGPIKYKEKGQKTRGLKIEEIETKEQMKNHLSSQYKIFEPNDLKKWFDKKVKEKSIISILFLVENEKLSKKTIPIQFGKIAFDIENIYDFFGIFHLKQFIEKRSRSGNRGYTYNGIIDGNFLRSGKEITFYKLLEENGIKIVSTNKAYPNAGRNFYDFLIDISGAQYYIEIIGSADKKYRKKLLSREQTYSSILIDQKYYKKFFEDASSNSIQKGKYHDW